VTDGVEIVAYDTAWPAMFEAEAERLRAVLDTAEVVGIEHFGSTAIPGLAAKPIIDICSLGYVYWAENPKLDRMFFVKGMPPYGERRTHHAHITEPRGEMWRLRLPFRDYLRAHPDEARRYETLKYELMARYPDRDEYTNAKTDYIEDLYRRIGVN
jgi:GrpB-like predicted nucleotidyltransferase (UPF0157 family)